MATTPSLLRHTLAVLLSDQPLEQVLRALLSICSDDLEWRYPCFVLAEQRSAEGRRDLVVVSGPAGTLWDVAGSEPPSAWWLPLESVEYAVVQTYLEPCPAFLPQYQELSRPLLTMVAVARQQALGLTSFALIPVQTAVYRLGVMVVAAGSSRSIGSTELSALESIANFAALAIERDRLWHELDDRTQQVSFLLKVTIDAQETERERICLELHDGVAQTLAPAFQYLQAVESQAELDKTTRSTLYK
ncbi:MAG: hypothetical protein M1118_03650, partial [Chloroflexi bacterium]|nr:hypothetical protein [Chloroflexota bacterium]